MGKQNTPKRLRVTTLLKNFHLILVFTLLQLVSASIIFHVASYLFGGE